MVIWISGDLSGIGFVDNQCFDNVIDLSKIKGNLNEKHLEFDEYIYRDVKFLKYTRHESRLESSNIVFIFRQILLI